MAQSLKILMHAPGCECQHPVSGHIVQIWLQIADLDNDDIGTSSRIEL